MISHVSDVDRFTLKRIALYGPFSPIYPFHYRASHIRSGLRNKPNATLGQDRPNFRFGFGFLG